jgi:16S rRNA G966 N2-methylase RsmD
MGVFGQTQASGTMLKPATSKTTGWRPSCNCTADPVPCTVLDPFGGSGTTGLVAREHGRSAILLEQSSTYADLARRRLGQPPEDLDAAQAAVRALPLFRGGTRTTAGPRPDRDE